MNISLLLPFSGFWPNIVNPSFLLRPPTMPPALISIFFSLNKFPSISSKINFEEFCIISSDIFRFDAIYDINGSSGFFSSSTIFDFFSISFILFILFISLGILFCDFFLFISSSILLFSFNTSLLLFFSLSLLLFISGIFTLSYLFFSADS